MKEVLSFLSNIFSLLGQVFLFVWKIAKFILARVYKFILAIGGALIGLFVIKKATEKHTGNMSIDKNK